MSTYDGFFTPPHWWQRIPLAFFVLALTTLVAPTVLLAYLVCLVTGKK